MLISLKLKHNNIYISNKFNYTFQIIFICRLLEFIGKIYKSLLKIRNATVRPVFVGVIGTNVSCMLSPQSHQYIYLLWSIATPMSTSQPLYAFLILNKVL